MGAESGFVNKLRDVEAENVSAASQQFMKMSANIVDMQTQIHELTERMASEVANRRAEDQVFIELCLVRVTPLRTRASQHANCF